MIGIGVEDAKLPLNVAPQAITRKEYVRLVMPDGVTVNEIVPVPPEPEPCHVPLRSVADADGSDGADGLSLHAVNITVTRTAVTRTMARANISVLPLSSRLIVAIGNRPEYSMRR